MSARRRRTTRPDRPRHVPAKVLLTVVVTAATLLGLYELAHLRHESAKDDRVAAYRSIVARHARRWSLPADLVERVIRAESGGDPRALSSADAKGLMQITPITEREVAEHVDLPDGDLYQPEYNIAVGTVYLRILLNRFGGDAHLALAAYHLGPTRVARLRRRHPGLTGEALLAAHAPAITRRYVNDILDGREMHLPVTDGPRRRG